MFNFEKTDEFLNFLLSKEVDFQELLEICQELLPEITPLHRKVTGENYPSPITQCILECYKIKNNFSCSVWQSSKYIKKEEIKPSALPLKFSRCVSQNQMLDYEIYNIEQLNIKNADIKSNDKYQAEFQTQNKANSPFKDFENKNADKLGENLKLKNIIISCIENFNGQYGKNGIAKILKGSKSIKDNDYNLASKNSEYFGLFKHLTLSDLTFCIDELIEDKSLSVKKVGFGRPVLVLADKTVKKLKQEPPKIEINEDEDENLRKIFYLINNGKNVFITGHAGTGKSYILNKLKEKIKELVVTSTTGIAAVNVRGQTIHSWAGVGICKNPVEKTVEKILKKSFAKNQILKCKILAIDEISMLDINAFEYIDSVLRKVRNTDEPFGGIRVIAIGDFFQLPPVDRQDKTENQYCFESNLWKDLDFHTVELTKNYRQNEENLIKALSDMRINKLDNDDIKLLKQRECKEGNELSDILHIFATNAEAEEYNNLKFQSIDSKEYVMPAFDGICRGENEIHEPKNEEEDRILKRIDSVCSAEKNILLKTGARVMLLINLDFDKGLINGSCGNVLEIDNNFILVNFDNGITYKVIKHDFEFYKNDILVAIRRQFPLRLAYGITIHKSQGMSLDKLVVDCSKIFEKGQAYVALSRIKNLNGLYLHNFHPKKVMTDEKVVNFYKKLNIFKGECK